MNEIKQCPICKGEQTSPFLVCKDNTVSKESFNIVACDNCNFRYTNPIPTIEKIGEYYKSEEYISHSNTSKGIVNKLYQIVRNITLKQKEKMISEGKQKGRLLDIGCGTGEFLNYCTQKGWNTLGIEPDENARKQGIENYSLDIKEEVFLKKIAADTIDVISMWHVLEHVYNLDERIEEIKRILKPDGTLFIAVPNCDSFDATFYKEFWAAYDVPRHLYHFRKENIKQLMGNHQLKVEEIFPMKFDSFYVSMLSEKYKTGNTNLLTAAKIGYKSNQKGKKTMNYSSLIYKITK